ncbi:Protein kinase-like domain protein [Niveomyces insectorum RCEF 264]|uniref:Protein kinase-like domain protein n=1 Tax=Niveomyces insectorum RCEF 264 TaxID=1081102 RepID=A0A162J3R9_9HYPO|nr:Protein kinase-like domain protein [Niveomyces insectorum RCEF 264]
MDEDVDYEYPRLLQIRVGHGRLNAIADLIDPFYPHVLKLVFRRSGWQRFVHTYISFAPAWIQHLVRKWWPQYTLPSCVVLKKLQKAEYTKTFEHEQAMYKKLEPAQGHLIPHFYGEAQCDGVRALLISYLPWPVVMKQPEPRLTVDEFKRRIEVATDEIAQYGVMYDDPKLSNVVMASGDRFMFIDLECVYEPDPGTEAMCRGHAVAAFVENYEYHLDNLKKQGNEPWF